MKFIKLLIVMMLMALPVFSQTGMPSITVTEAEKEFTLPIKRAKVDVKIVGSLAITTYDIHFFNPNKRTLEGQLDFPLADGVVVSRFAMDVNKKLREGVIVEKDKGRQTFEKIVKRRVDPGLLEVTRGNNFRSRVYPLFSNKEKHIVIAYEEELKVTPDGLKYSLPLDMPNQLNEFSFKATIYSDFAKPINNSTNGSKFRHKDDSYTLLSEYTDYKAKELYEFIIPYFGEESVQLETYNNEDFFRISLNPEMMLQEKEKPKTISILWDISASRLNSDIDKDLELLEEYLKYNQCNVELVPFSLYSDEPSYFPNVDFAELKANINGLRIDGATNYSSVDISKLRGDEVFIFSDGIDNIGEGGFGETDKPMYIINSSSISDHDACRKLAQKTGGKYINLVDENTESALNLLTYNFPYFMGIEGAASEVYPKNEVVKGNINISGKLQSSSQLKLKFGYGDKVAKIIPVNITESNRTNSGILHKIWAKQKLADLNLNQKQNEVEITNLAKQYSLVTAFTSLIVLETARDYYWYKIEPPEELREEYLQIVDKYDAIVSHRKPHNEEENRQKDLFISHIKRKVGELKRWYRFNFEEQRYLDSCFREIDKKIEPLVEEFEMRHDSAVYYTIDLKQLFPNFNFKKYKMFCFFISDEEQHPWDSSFIDIYPFGNLIINKENQIYIDKLSHENLGKSIYIDRRNINAFPLTEDTVKQLEFSFDLYYQFCEGLASEYQNQSGIDLINNRFINIPIKPEDVSDYYNKIFIIKNLATYISPQHLESWNRWWDYSTKLDQVISNKVEQMKTEVSDSFYEVIDLDSLLPEDKDLNKIHFKYLDVSWRKEFWNYKNDSLYKASRLGGSCYFDDDIANVFDNIPYLAFDSDYTTKCISDIESKLNLPQIHRSLIHANGLYLITPLDYKQNIGQIREKFRNQIKQVHNRIAFQLFKDSSEFDFSKVYIFKNLGILKDREDYLGNMKNQYYYSKKENAEKNFQLVAEDYYVNEHERYIFESYNLSEIDTAAFMVDKYVRVFWKNPNKFDNNIMGVDSILLYSGSKSKNYNNNKLNLIPRYTSFQIDRAFIEADFLEREKLLPLDSIVVKYSFKTPNKDINHSKFKNLIDYEDLKKYDNKQASISIPIKNIQNIFESLLFLNNPIVFPKKTTATLNNNGKSTLVGFVFDDSEKPLPGATVLLVGSKKGAKTKPNGSFAITNIIPGTYDLKVTYVGKDKQTRRNIKIDSNKIHQVYFMLKDAYNFHSLSVVCASAGDSHYIENPNLDDNIARILNNTNDKSQDVKGSDTLASKTTTVSYQSSKEYYKELSSVALGELEDTYFELRKDNSMNPSFFFDAAKVFEKHGKIKEACRVASNLAEINLEDHENLRRVAGFLMKNKEYKLAKSIYQHILKIRVEEPQSFRDYALCLAEMGEFQAAADSLYSLFTRDIPADFKGMISTLVTEFNTLLLQHKDQIDISKYDPDYIFETPVDLRIEITWVMDETDIDLWVIEPDGTKCYYAQQFTKIGGFLSKDMIRGYGPEVYMIKKAIAGKYKIKADYFSNRRQKSSIDPQIRCKIYTNYGRPNQKVQETIGKIEELSGEVDLGEVVIE